MKNALFTKSQAAEVASIIIAQRIEEDEKSKVYAKMNPITAEDFDGLVSDEIENYCDDHNVPCVTTKDIEAKLNAYICELEK